MPRLEVTLDERLRTYEWLREKDPFIFPDWHVHWGAPPVVHDYFLDEEIPIKAGSVWVETRRPYSKDPIVIAAIVKYQDDLTDLAVWFHRVSAVEEWRYVPPMTAGYPWQVRQFIHEFRPTVHHPRSWFCPSIWDRLVTG